MDVTVRPKPQFIVMSQGIQSVIGSPVRIAASRGQGGQFAEHGQIRRGAQGRLELRQRGHRGALEKLLQRLGRETVGFHNVRITPITKLSSVILTFCMQEVPAGQDEFKTAFSSLTNGSSGPFRSQTHPSISSEYAQFTELVFACALRPRNPRFCRPWRRISCDLVRL